MQTAIQMRDELLRQLQPKLSPYELQKVTKEINDMLNAKEDEAYSRGYDHGWVQGSYNGPKITIQY